MFGSPPYDPACAAFGYNAAERLMKSQLGNVSVTKHSARIQVAEPDDVFLALTSYPPGDRADETQLAAFRNAIDEAFRAGNGILGLEKQSGLFLCWNGR